VLLNSDERLTELGSEFTGNLAEDIQNIFFSCGFHLLLGQHLAGTAVLGSQIQHLLAPKARDRAVQDRGAGGSFADLPCNVRSKARIGWFTHQVQGPVDAFVGDEAQERRLAKLHRHALTQSIIEDWVTRRVLEIGKDD
jgi:hypothetical protein